MVGLGGSKRHEVTATREEPRKGAGVRLGRERAVFSSIAAQTVQCLPRGSV